MGHPSVLSIKKVNVIGATMTMPCVWEKARHTWDLAFQVKTKNSKHSPTLPALKLFIQFVL